MMTRLLPESFVQKAIAKHLRNAGWSHNLVSASGKAHRVDIRVRHKSYGRWFLVEVKGDPGPAVKFPHASRDASFNSALGQILSRMVTKKGDPHHKYGNKFGIGFPRSFESLVMRRLPWAVAHRVTLHVFFADGRGRVQQFDWRELKDRQLDAARSADRRPKGKI